MGALIDSLQKSSAKVILVSFSNPYIASELPATPAYLVAWGPAPVSQRAAARALLGLSSITGQLPITIPSVAGYGAGLRRDALAMSSQAVPTP
jgi:beta-N-acetylhexosaminidase